MAKTILIVDDDPTQRRLLQAAIERHGFHARLASDGQTGVEAALSGLPCDLVLLDLVMPGFSGMEALAAIRAQKPALPVIVLTAHGGLDSVVAAMQAGANDFLVKPASPERLIVSVRNALKVNELTGEVSRLKKKAANEITFADLIATAPAMRNVVRMGKRAAASSIPVLILGESGVGKEMIARAIQGESDRAGRPFVTVNCGALPENLVESILFGHEKGAFTGAVDRHAGKFVEANGGTLFLDEVGELPPEAQVKLLRALQEGEIDPVGARRPVRVDVRIVSATNKDLSQAITTGAFREDLYYRLNVFPIEAPPLRARKEDIPALVEHFIKRFNAEEGRQILGTSSAAMTMLLSFDWPGNVRQLENAVFRAVVLCDGEHLQPEDFPQLLHLRAADMGANSAPALTAPSPAPGGIDLTRIAALDAQGHVRRLQDLERDIIQLALETYHGQMSEAARRLGIGRSTLYRKLREYDLDVWLDERSLAS